MKNYLPFILLFCAVLTIAPRAMAEESNESESCLSCHGGHTGPGSHPVGVDYETARRYSYSLQPSNTQMIGGGTIQETLLVNGKVECTTCHVTHDEPSESKYRMRQVPGRWVRESDDYTSLCMACHDPK